MTETGKKENLKAEKETHYSNGKSFCLKLKSREMPFVLHYHKARRIDYSEKLLQDFVRLIEKKFDVIWYIGTDYFGDELYERFIFHHGGFMEISMEGEIRCFFIEDKRERMKKAIFHAIKKMSSRSAAERIIRELKSGQKLISLKESINLE